MRRTAILIVLTVLLLIPVIALAQGSASDVVELVFGDNGAQVGITDTIESVAAVTIEVDGQRYLIKVPVTIDIDAVLPLSDSLVSIPAGARVGQLGLVITDVEEFAEETDVVFPGYWGGYEETYEPSDEGYKLVVVYVEVTNAGSEQAYLDSYYTVAVDDLGRTFEEIDYGCDSIDPGQTGACVFIFDVPDNVELVGLDVQALDRRQISFPR